VQIVTEEFLHQGLESLNHINKSQLTLLNEASPAQKGWKDRVLGQQISDARAELFILLKGVSGEKNQQKVIDDFKKLQGHKKAIAKLDTTQEKSSHQSINVEIYCDGGCVPNPGKSGSGVSIYHDGKLFQLWYGLYDPNGTNNTAELNALYQSLLLAQQELDQGHEVEILCDSMYAINCISVWAVGWEKKGWTKKGGAIKNLEIIQKAYALYNKLKSQIKLSHVKAHAGTEGNELADRMTMYTIDQEEETFKCYEEAIDIPKLLKMRAG
jgi:ribonuclease HI